SLLVFPLLVIVVVSVALFDDRTQLVAVGSVSALALLVISATQLGPTSNLATAVFEVAALGVVAGAVQEVGRHAREAEGSAEKKVGELESIDHRLRLTLEAATIGLGVAMADGRWVEVNQRLAGMLGKSRDDLLQAGLLEVMSDADRGVVGDALGKLARREIVRWESEVQQSARDGRRIPVSLAIAAISDRGLSEPLLLVQEADISARKRLDAMRDTVVAVRQVIVTANSWDQAAPALLASLCTHLGWDAAQYWSVKSPRHALKLSNSWHKETSNVDGLDDPARNLSI